MKTPVPSRKTNGFALIVTISLMILLTIIAVGMLTLSAISLRTASQGDAMATARANARVALMLALGDLQRNLGPDRAISATSGIVAENPGKPNLTGSWESWDYSPLSSPNYDAEHEDRFQSWLVSSPNPDDLKDKDFAISSWSGEKVDLVSDGALGGNAPAASRATAGVVPVKNSGSVKGAYAWHVADEGVKARINLYRDPDKEHSLWEMRGLLAGQRPNPEMVSGITGQALDFMPTDESRTDYSSALETVGKVTDLEQVSLLANTANIRSFRNDVTPFSTGVMADVRTGGLKRDLSTVFALGTSLPEEFRGGNSNVYQSAVGISGPSDPYWSTLSGYYNIYSDVTTADSAPTYYQRQPSNISSNTLNPQTRYFPGPVIAKVEALMTYVTRDSHANWVGSLKGVDPRMLYMGHLMYTPLVTLHNPYNINISFDEMEITIDGVPIGFRFFMNNTPQSQELVPLNEMFVNDGARNKGKRFVVRIANWRSASSSSTSGPITLKPGQTLICSPYLDPRSSFANPITRFFDWQNDLTDVEVKAIPGFNGPCIGFDVDWTTPTHQPYDTNPSSQFDKRGVFGLRSTDTVKMEFGLVQPKAGSTGEFTVEAKLKSRGAERRYGGLTFRYSNQATLDKLLLSNKIYKYPADGSSFRALDAYVPNSDPISRHARAKTVAVFSAYARTTNGGVYETNSRSKVNGALNVLRDGQIAGKPYMFHNPARNVVRIDLQNEKPGAQSHEMNFQPFISDKEYENYFFIDSTNRTPSVTGNSTLKGIKSGSYLELPTGPMQTIADFRRSNAFSCGYLPSFVQPVANSVVSPLMSTSQVVETNPAVANYQLLDHSFLANHALYDRFYFSTFAEYGATNSQNVFSGFMSGDLALINQAFEPYLPSGQSLDRAANEMFSSANRPSDEAYQKAAEFQLLRGAFNVNSTSVEAWKAKLAALSKERVPVLWGKSGTIEYVGPNNIPVPSMSLMNAGDANNGGVALSRPNDVDDSLTNEWNGFRQLTPGQIDSLARHIVEEVRLRGPFLSMSEFVNRRIGSESDLTRYGALHSAIMKAKLNDSMFQNQVAVTSSDISDNTVYGFKTPEVSTGNPAEGAPGWITQGDLMKVLEPAISVRSDTFVIRVYGDARDKANNITARAYAEAVVQRVPEYVDPADRPSLNAYTDSTSEANKTFGRRFQLVSFRWLSPSEV
ncbi:MAG: hypothetical protein KDN05_03870 [Verrucomicrobiae bacterium]|nr:hypothetical protein [Verrucomicrobiae bacterium]